MLRKKLAHWDILLLLITLSQCDQSIYQPVENISHWTLNWEAERRCDNPLRGIDFKDGVICSVPSEQAVYCLCPTGDCWKCTQDLDRGVVCTKITSLPEVVGQQTFFAFPAGSIQKQTLHVGILDEQQVKLFQCKGNSWEVVGDYTLNIETLKTPVKGAACSICGGESQLNGLIALKPQAASNSLITLVYDVATKSLEASDMWNSKGDQWGTPQTIVEAAPSILFVSHFDKQHATASMTKNSSRKVEFYKSEESEQLRLFILQGRGCMRKLIKVLYVEEDKKIDLKFYVVGVSAEDGDWGQYEASSLPEQAKEAEKDEEKEDPEADDKIDHSESLILPFSDAVYILTQDKNGESVYYKGSIRRPS